MRKMSCLLLLTLTMSSFGWAQESFEEDLRKQPFLYGSLGGFPSGAHGGTTFGFGAGMDFLISGGFGLGFDVILFRPTQKSTPDFGAALVTASYHFARSSGFVPF